MGLLEQLSDDEFHAVARADRFIMENGLDADVEAQLRGRFNNLVFGRFNIPSAPRGSIVCLRTMQRDDYKALFGSILSTLQGWPVVRVEDYVGRQPRLNMDTIERLTASVGVLTERLRHMDCPQRRAAVAVRLAAHEYVAERTLELEPAALVCFSSMQPAENLAALVARRRGIPTVTMQHGLYVEYKELSTINQINYELQPCEHFLAWGEHTAELIRRHHDDVQVHICGKPETYTGAPSQTAADRPALMVITDQVLFDEANRNLLEIATAYGRKTGLTVKARFHPSNPKAEYLKLFPSLVEDRYFLDCALVIGHTSSLIYEAITLGKRTLRMRTEAPAIELPDALTFETFEELCEKAEAPVQADVADRYIASTGAESLAGYRAFFDGLVADLAATRRLDQVS